jgi:deoxyribonucleoside regulator
VPSRPPIRSESDTVRAARLYYTSQLTQAQVGERLGLTRWKVNRLLAEARETGIVRIEVVTSSSELEELAECLRDAYELVDCVVVPAPLDDDRQGLEGVGRAAAAYLAGLSPPPAILAVSWGRTMDIVSRHVPAGWTSGIRVVLANGALSRTSAPTGAAGIAERIAAAGAGTAEILPGPAICARADTRALLERDEAVAQVLDPARRAPVAIFGLGALSIGSVLVRSHYLDAADVEALRSRGAVGDILGRFVNSDGDICDLDLDARTLALTRADLRSKELAIGVAAGTRKRDIVAAALTGEWVNVLVTDEQNARNLLGRGEHGAGR